MQIANFRDRHSSHFFNKKLRSGLSAQRFLAFCETGFLTRVWLKNDQNLSQSFQTFLAVSTKKSEMTSYLKSGYDVMNYFAKFEKFLPHSIIIPSFDCRKSNARVRQALHIK